MDLVKRHFVKELAFALFSGAASQPIPTASLELVDADENKNCSRRNSFGSSYVCLFRFVQEKLALRKQKQETTLQTQATRKIY